MRYYIFMFLVFIFSSVAARHVFIETEGNTIQFTLYMIIYLNPNFPIWCWRSTSTTPQKLSPLSSNLYFCLPDDKCSTDKDCKNTCGIGYLCSCNKGTCEINKKEKTFRRKEAGKTTQQEATILVTSHPLQAWVPKQTEDRIVATLFVWWKTETVIY